MLSRLMNIQLYLLTTIIISIFSCSNSQTNKTLNNEQADSILKIEMNLSALGVESDDFPSIDVVIDFLSDSSYCRKWFYNAANKDSIYALTKTETQRVLSLLKISDLQKLKAEYNLRISDQPRSKTTVYTRKNTFIIDDYGLQGEYPLQELYKIVYKY